MFSCRRLLPLLALAIGSAWNTVAQPAATPPPPTPDSTRQLDPVTVEAAPYQPLASTLPLGLPFLAGPQLPPMKFSMGMNFNTMGAMVVTATRTPQAPAEVAATLRLLPAESIRQAPTVSLDGALRSIPAFSLFRRSDSLSANPTAQGVSLRGLGPSGASRSLLLLDGVPLNDPFGGWVAWSKLPREGLSKVEVVPGGGATAWGNAALGGAVQIFTALRTGLEIVDRPPAPMGWVTTGSLRFNATVGDYETYSAELALTVPTRVGVAQLLGRGFGTDGFVLVAPERRGPIDLPAWSRHRWLTVRWQQPLGQKLDLLATVRGFEEKRGNGTPYQQNHSHEQFASLALAGQPVDTFAWTAVAYVQDQTYASTFSSVNAARTIETPASDQFDVPATAVGAAWTGVLKHRNLARTSFGVDARHVRGETREYYAYVAGNFTRLREAGGEQRLGGMFVLHERWLADDLKLSLGARLDQWNESDGHRRESDRATGATLRDDHYPDRDGTSFSPSAGLLWTPRRAWRLRASGQQAFRRPTLNELYRPFRVGSTVTEANPALETEAVTSAEAGAEWTLFGPPQPRPANRPANASYTPPPTKPQLTLGVTAFWNDLRDAVGNVTIARGPGTFPIFGFLPAGGLGRLRLNLDRIRVRGLEFSARWTPVKSLTLTGDVLINDATVQQADVAPALVGNRVAQVPRESITVGATWLAPGKLTVTPRMRAINRQFEDDENQLILGAAVIFDLSVSRPISKHLEVYLTVENLGDARIETGRSADGVVNIGTPRFALIGLRGSW